jgi:hypothetical protein
MTAVQLIMATRGVASKWTQQTIAVRLSMQLAGGFYAMERTDTFVRV